MLEHALQTSEAIFTTGLVLQELLQGFTGPKARDAIVERFAALPLVVPDREDHIHAAELRNTCRRKGVQVGTIDALFAQLCIQHELLMLSTDTDFERIAKLSPLLAVDGIAICRPDPGQPRQIVAVSGLEPPTY